MLSTSSSVGLQVRSADWRNLVVVLHGVDVSCKKSRWQSACLDFLSYSEHFCTRRLFAVGPCAFVAPLRSDGSELLCEE